MEKENLRKCKTKYGLYYFHKWVEVGETQTHAEDPAKDICYAKTFALLEDIKSGECGLWNPNDVVFVKDCPECGDGSGYIAVDEEMIYNCSTCNPPKFD